MTLYAQWEKVPLSIDISIPVLTSENDLQCNYDEQTKMISVYLSDFSGTFYLYLDGNTTESLTSNAGTGASLGKATFDPFIIQNLTVGMHSFFITATKNGIKYSQTMIAKIIEIK